MGDGLKAAKSAATGPTEAQRTVLKQASNRTNGTIFIGGAGRHKMLQRCARAGWGEVRDGKFIINDAGRAVAREV